MYDVMELFQLYKDDVYRLAVSYTHSILLYQRTRPQGMGSLSPCRICGSQNV